MMLMVSSFGEGSSGSRLMVPRLAMDEVRRRTSSRMVVNANGREKLSSKVEKGVPDSYKGVSQVSGQCNAVIEVKSSDCRMHRACS